MFAVGSHDSNLSSDSSEGFIPVACHYDMNTLITKNGELLQTIQINGINSEKISENLYNLREVVRKSITDSVTSQKYAFWVHTIRRKADLDDGAEYHGFLAANIHDIWCRKNYWHDKFVNNLYITIVHESPQLKLYDYKTWLRSLSPGKITHFEQEYFDAALQDLTQTADKLLLGLSEYGAAKLGIRVNDGINYSDLMFLYRRIVHLNESECMVPTADISTALASHQYSVGSDRIEVIGDGHKKFAAIMSIKEYQEVSSDSLDKFLQIPVEMIATEVFYFIDKKEVAPIYEYQNYILGISKDKDLRKIKGFNQIFDDQNTRTQFCHQQISFMVIGDDYKMLETQIAKASDTLSKIGIVHVREDINLEKTFWSQLPGNFSFLSRMKPTVLQNTAALASLHNFPTGNQYSKWGKAITLLRTERGTPYFMNFHDRSHRAFTCLIGEKKAGKTTLLNFLLAESDKYLPTTVVITDDMDSGLYIKARGGRWFQREKGIINPLLCEDNEQDRQYLFEFFKVISKHYFHPLSNEEISQLKELINKVFVISKNERKLSKILASMAMSETLAKRLSPYQEGGIYYGIFERDEPLTLYDSDLLAVNLESFDDKEFTKKNYPKEKKLIEQFEYDLNSSRAVKVAVVLALFNLIKNSNNDKKILVIDNLEQIMNLEHYSSLISELIMESENNDVVPIFSVSTDALRDVYNNKIPQDWLNSAATSVIFPAEVSVVGLDKVLPITQVELKKLAALTVSSRMFLIRQNDKSITAELSIGGLPGLTRLFCSGKSEIELYKEVVKEHGEEKPEDWLEPLYNELEKVI